MEASLLLRLVPAAAVAVVVAWVVGRDRGVRPGRAADEVLRALVVGLVAGRIVWLALEGSWRTVTATFLLVRAGVVTWAGVLVAVAWMAWRTDDEDRAWSMTAAPVAALAGVSAWHAGCAVEAVCAGRPVSWGVALPGFVSPVVPLGYVLAVVAAALALVAWRHRCAPAVAVGAAAGYAAARTALGFLEAPLAGYPTSDQVWGTLAVLVLATIAWRVRDARPCEVTAAGDGDAT